MFPTTVRFCASLLAAAALAPLAARAIHGDDLPRELRPFRDNGGEVVTMATAPFDRDNPFFASLGTNDRSCATCHQASDAWSVTPAHLRQRFETTAGRDPIFRPVDGATCDSADVSTRAARRSAYRLLLTKGLIRVGMSMPGGAEFSLVSVDDPYGCITADRFSVYRRPLPSTNLKFLSTVMWDGREMRPGHSLDDIFRQQVIDATTGHAEATVLPTDDQVSDIVAFELSLATAQEADDRAGRLHRHGARGGPATIVAQPFFIGINDPLGLNPTGAPFDPTVFTLFDAWRRSGHDDDDRRGAAREAIARGEAIFNGRPITIRGVGGLNDALGAPAIQGTCTTCHDTPNAGNHSVSMPLNIGTSDASRRPPDLPLYTFRCTATGQVVQTSDPGRALVTGHCADLGKVKGPVLRALAARPPYFHNGSAAALEDVVAFYDERFGLGLSARERADLVAFLRAL